MNTSTIIVLLVVLALVIIAIHNLRKDKGSCSCGGNVKKAGFSGCANCTANCPLKGK